MQYKSIPSHPNYFVNENGIIVDAGGNYVSVSQDYYGYLYTHLDNEKVYIHEIVASLYLNSQTRDPEFEKFIVHKDNDILHNHYSNLKFSPYPENIESFLDRKVYSNMDKLGAKQANKVSQYVVYNDETGNYVICKDRIAVSELIHYELISLKNMVGNDRKISLGPYKGYKIKRVTK